MNRWRTVYAALRDAGIPVSMSGQRTGVCCRSECVVDDCGAVGYERSCLSGTASCRVWLLCPIDQPDGLSELAARVRVALAPLVRERLLHLSVPLSATMVEDDIAALSAYIEYVSYYSDK